MNINFGDRIKSERKRVKKSSSDFASYCGVGRNTQTNYEKSERKPDLDYLAKANELGCDIVYIVTGTKLTENIVNQEAPATYQIENNKPFDQEPYIEIPLLDIEVSAEHGTDVASEKMTKGLSFKRHWLAKRNLQKEFLAVVTAKGDSMEPSINNNDAMLIDTHPIDNLTDGVYVIQLDNGLLVKRLQRQIDGGIEIISDNTSYRSQVLEQDKLTHLHIVGKVVWVGKDL